MNHVPAVLVTSFLASAASAQCDGPSIDVASYVATLGAFDAGRVSLITSESEVQLFERVDGTWMMVEAFLPDHPASFFSMKVPVGFVQASSFVAGLPMSGSSTQGEVHVRDSAGNTSILAASDGVFADGFGEGLAMHGDLLVVGASLALYDAGSCGPGKGYVFTRDATGWTEVAQFGPHDYGTSVVTRYGYKLDTDGDTIVFGSPSEGSDPWITPPVVGAGAVYVYEQGPGGWQESAKLVASDATPGAFFGADVVVRGDQILVGAAQAGAVYVFERGPAGWSETQIVTPSAGQPGDKFGTDLDIDGARMVVGAPWTDGDVVDAGAFYILERGTGGVWSETQRVVATGVDAYARVGTDVVIEGNQVCWSSSWSDEVHFTSLGIDEVSNYCTSAPNSSGSAAVLTATGCDSLTANGLTLEATHLPANAVGLFFYGPSPAQYPLGNGFMCIGAGRRRLGLQSSGGAGVLRRALDFGSPQAQGIQPGATWYFQAFFRDRFLGAGFDLSDALAIEIRG